jgi:hypothetical protein
VKVVCIASGPSLIEEDVEAVGEWGGKVIVANTTFLMAPWADALFAMDRKWWELYYPETMCFQGRKFTTATLPQSMDVTKASIPNYRNSGANCVSLAASEGATDVVLLGFDCSHDGSRTHWHGSHPFGLSDAKTVRLWPLIFDRLAKDMKRRGVKVWNASRRTALECFERVDLREALST